MSLRGVDDNFKKETYTPEESDKLLFSVWPYHYLTSLFCHIDLFKSFQLFLVTQYVQTRNVIIPSVVDSINELEIVGCLIKTTGDQRISMGVYVNVISVAIIPG